MKYLAQICIAGLAALSLAACSHVAQYSGEDFVAFRSSSFSANESAGSIKIPVIAYPQNGNPNTSVSFKVVEKTAKSGTDFTVEPASGVLNFTGDSLQYITVNVVDHDGLYTGDLTFNLQIESATNNYSFPHYNTVSVKIVDEDHPLLELFGTYKMGGVILTKAPAYAQETWDMEMSPYDGDVTRVWMDVFVPICSSKYYGSNFTHGKVKVYGVVSNDKTQISIPVPQETPAHPDDLFNGFTADDLFWLYKWDDEAGVFITEPGNLVFTKQDDGSFKADELDYFGIATPDTTDEMFYYLMNVWDAYFVKK